MSNLDQENNLPETPSDESKISDQELNDWLYRCAFGIPDVDRSKEEGVVYGFFWPSKDDPFVDLNDTTYAFEDLRQFPLFTDEEFEYSPVVRTIAQAYDRETKDRDRILVTHEQLNDLLYVFSFYTPMLSLQRYREITEEADNVKFGNIIPLPTMVDGKLGVKNYQVWHRYIDRDGDFSTQIELKPWVEPVVVEKAEELESLNLKNVLRRAIDFILRK